MSATEARRRPGLPFLAAALALSAAIAAAQADAPGPSARVSRDFVVGSGAVWTITDLDIHAGERVVFAAGGSARCPGAGSSFGPEGLPRGFRDLLRILPDANAGRGALLGRIGDPDVGLPFAIGAGRELVSPSGGMLSLGTNRPDADACAGEFTVHVDVFPPTDGSTPTQATRADALPGVDTTLFDRLPRRVGDQVGNPGDMINFLILGPDDGMKAVFTAAGWVRVDADVRNALVSGVISSLSKEAYLTLPMSQLYLFDRPQDFGWAHAEPIKVAASRHHLRVWRASFEVNGTTVWVGAATHDIGFDRDRRNNGITHKIDPDVDLERDYVEKTLTSTGLVSAFTYVLPDKPLREATTATGGTFHSDGRVLVLKLVDGKWR